MYGTVILFVVIAFLGLIIREFSLKNLEHFDVQRILYTGDYWNEYRIGDLYHLWHKEMTFSRDRTNMPNCRQGRCFPIDLYYHRTHFPGSIAANYHEHNVNGTNNNKVAMMEAIRDYEKSHPYIPTDCVLHMRVGDVVNDNLTMYTKIDNKPWWDRLITQLGTHPEIKTITIIAGMHKKIPEQKSIEFINSVQTMLNARGYKVVLNLGRSPDDDILTAYHSKYVVSTGGGYGRLLVEFACDNGSKHIVP
jgi:hypothetical protein